MYYMSEQMEKLLYTSHTVISWIDVKSPTQETMRLPAIDGSVSVDRTAAVRRRLSATCVDPLDTLVPGGDVSGSPLTPYGTELRPYRGVVYRNSNNEIVTEVVPLGVFRLSKVDITDDNSGLQIGLEAYDLSRTVSRDKFTSPYTLATGTNIVTAIKTILARTFDELEYDAISTTRTTTAPRIYDINDDPWEAVTELATSLGCDIYFDVEGKVIIAPPVDIGNLPSAHFKYIEGENCVMQSLSRVFTDEPGYNGVVVTGESPGDELPPVRAIAWDEEPTSVTYHLGPYGEVPMFVTDQLIKTTQDAQNTAHALLKNLLGFASQLNVTVAVNPAFEAGDVVEVVRAKSKVNDLYVIDSFDVPLAASGMQSLNLRQKRRVA